MGVDFITCSKCRETYPDCGPHDQCEKHSLCPVCMPDRAYNGCADDKHDGNGYLLPEHCPVCKDGGSELEQLQAAARSCFTEAFRFINGHTTEADFLAKMRDLYQKAGGR